MSPQPVCIFEAPRRKREVEVFKVEVFKVNGRAKARWTCSVSSMLSMVVRSGV